MAGGFGLVRAWVVLFFAAVFFSQSQAGMVMAKSPPKLTIDAARTRITKLANPDWSDREQTVQLEVIVTNGSLNQKAVDGLTMHYWSLAQSLADKKAFTVIDSGTFDVNLTNTPEGREIRHKGESLKLAWDDTGGYSYGKRYKGFILVVTSAQNEVVAVKSNQPSWQTGFEKAFNLKTGSWCDWNLKPVTAPRY